jgi:phosphoribosylanthranilate isomerase
MSIWIKICANTTLADAQLAVDAGADAVGFVFAPSPRQVTAEQVAAITPSLPDSVEKIGVFVDTDFAEIAATIEACKLTGVQLHSKSSGELSKQLRDRFGPQLRILGVIHFGEDTAQELEAACANANIDGALIDSRIGDKVGGTGKTFDWQAARATVFADGQSIKLIAAGGMSPDNVTEAIATLRPWGVDVASGVESVPGRKDPEKVGAFVVNARSAALSR